MAQVHNDNIRDLLVDDPKPLRLHDAPLRVAGLTRVAVRTAADADRVMRVGASRRACIVSGSRAAPRVEVRSHGVYALSFMQRLRSGELCVSRCRCRSVCRLFLIDVEVDGTLVLLRAMYSLPSRGPRA